MCSHVGGKYAAGREVQLEAVEDLLLDGVQEVCDVNVRAFVASDM